MNLSLLFNSKPENRSVESPLEEDIHGIHFEEELLKALNKAHFRQAVRLLYLQSLKELSDRNLIDWQLGKTNRTYLLELKEMPMKEHFASLTGQFEYVWYGGFSLGEQEFERIQEEFRTFNKQVHPSKP